MHLNKPIEVVLQALSEAAGMPPKQSGDGWKTCCPAHDDRNPSLSVSEGDDGRVLLKCWAGCSVDNIMTAAGLVTADLFLKSGRQTTFRNPDRRPTKQSPKPTWPTDSELIANLEQQRGPRSAAWTYRDQNDRKVGAVIRWDTEDGKDIRPIHRNDAGWSLGAMPEPRPLYRLRNIIDAEVVFVCEGEKAVDAAVSIELRATTSSGGSNATKQTDWSPLAGKHVVIIPDNDEPGRQFAETVAGILLKLDPSTVVSVIDLADDWPGLPEKGDVFDWREAHDAVEPEVLRQRIETLVAAAAPWAAPQASAVPLIRPESSDGWAEPVPLPAGLARVEPFDEALLPESLRPWVSDIAERLQCPADFPAVGAMIVLAGVVGRKVGIRPQRRTDWQVVPNLWGAVIGRPGIMKSPALQEPLSILRRLEIVAKQEFESAIRDHEAGAILAKATRDVLQGDLKKALKAKSGAEEIAAQMQELDFPSPTRRRHIANDSTVEKLGELLNENPNGIVVFRDELTGFLRSLDKPGQEGNRAFYLESWNGNGRFVYDRIGRGTLDIVAAITSIIGGIQPGPLSEYLRKMSAGGAGDDGLIQRFQLAVWPDNSKTWRNVDTFPDSRAKKLAVATYERLDRLQPVELATELDEYEPVPFLRFDDAAQEMFDAWREVLEPRLRSGDEHPAIESHLAKYRSLVPSLALLIHLADEPYGGPVTAESLQRALNWARYLESHARRIYGAISQGSTVSANALARKIQDGTLQDGFTLRDVYRPAWSGLSDRTDADAAVNVLIDHDWLSEETLKTGGKPKTVYRINPAVFSGNLLKAN